VNRIALIYTDHTFPIGISAVPSIRPPLLLIAALLVAATFSTTTRAQSDASADAPADADAKSTFRQSTITRCEQQYSVEQCQDEQFLEDNFHLNSLEVALRAAGRRNQLERDALRELTLQHLCDQSPSSVCAGADDPARCAEEIVQSCTTLATRTANCQQSAKLVCADAAATGACLKQQIAFCPSIKKQKVEELLAKYPQLNLEQKNRVVKTAQEMDGQPSAWLANMVGWLGRLL
jgi:hypothetical protein